MNRVLFLRRVVFKTKQNDFASIAGVAQATVCRWEKGESCPNLDDLRRIRAEAARRGIAWDHEWLFSEPSSVRANSEARP